MKRHPRNESTSDLGTVSLVVLCMSASAALALAIEEVWKWLPWAIVIVAASLSLITAAASRRASEPRKLDG